MYGVKMKAILSAIILLLSIPAYGEIPTIYVATANDRESFWLENTLTKSFCELSRAAGREPTYEIDCLDKVRNEILPHVILVTYLDYDGKLKHKVPNLDHYPSYRIGKYGKWKPFPDRIKIHPTYPVRFIKYVIDDYTLLERILAYEEYKSDIECLIVFKYCKDTYNDTYDLYNDIFSELKHQYTYMLYNSVRNRRYDNTHKMIPTIAFKPKPVLENPLDFTLPE